METLTKHFTPTVKRPRLNHKLSFGILVLGGGTFLAYYGYCWGWWGRSSLLLQYLFQCKCPPISAEFRYPEQIDVILTACQHDTFIMSPSGRFLYVEKRETENNVGYFWNLQTNERIPYTIPDGDRYFLTDDLLFLRTDYGKGVEGGEHILDRTIGVLYPLRNIDTYTESEANVSRMLEKLRNAQKVFYIRSYGVIVIEENFQVFPDRNFIIYYDIPGKDPDSKEKFLQYNSVPYIQIPRLAYSLGEDVSPNDRFLARDDGIYLSASNKKIVDVNNMSSSLYGWVYDSTGAIYAKPFGSCLIRYWFPLMDGSNCLIRVPQPILKLKVPQEYLDGTTP